MTPNRVIVGAALIALTLVGCGQAQERANFIDSVNAFVTVNDELASSVARLPSESMPADKLTGPLDKYVPQAEEKLALLERAYKDLNSADQKRFDAVRKAAQALGDDLVSYRKAAKDGDVEALALVAGRYKQDAQAYESAVAAAESSSKSED